MHYNLFAKNLINWEEQTDLGAPWQITRYHIKRFGFISLFLNGLKALKKTFHGTNFDKDVFFDVIIEQTFFCAIDPLLREKYVEKTHQILKEKGCIIGLLFSKEFENEGPPFGSSHEEYINLF